MLTAARTQCVAGSEQIAAAVRRLYDRRAMVPRNRARYLAPIALAAAIIVSYLVVHAALNNKQPAAQPQVVHTSSGTAKPPQRVDRAGSYVVKSGDTLSNISANTGVPLPTLEALNPSVDPNALHAGQRLRLRR